MLLNGGQVLTERAKISARLEAWIDSDTGERLSFAEANARTNQLAHVLLARGLAPGDRVGVLMGNTPLHASAYFACAKAGFVFVALNWRLTVAELAYQLADSGATVICRSPRRTSEVASMQLSHAMFARCDITAPFGRPVVPLVYIMYSGSSSEAPIGGSRAGAPAMAA